LRSAASRLVDQVIVCLAGDHDDRNQQTVLLTAQPIEELDAVQIGQAIVEQHAVGRLGATQGQAILAGIRLLDEVANRRPVTHQPPERRAILWTVVDDEDAPGVRLLLAVEQLLAENLDVRRGKDAKANTIALCAEHLDDHRVPNTDNLLWLAGEDEHDAPPCLLSPLVCPQKTLCQAIRIGFYSLTN